MRDLEALLREAAPAIEFPAAPHIAPAVIARLYERGRSRGRLRLVAVAGVLLLVSGGSVLAVRVRFVRPDVVEKLVDEGGRTDRLRVDGRPATRASSFTKSLA